jgi:hypothetical protein
MGPLSQDSHVVSTPIALDIHVRIVLGSARRKFVGNNRNIVKTVHASKFDTSKV